MDQAEFTLSRPVCLSLPIEEADKLLQEKDGRCALVYLALLRARGKALPRRAHRPDRARTAPRRWSACARSGSSPPPEKNSPPRHSAAPHPRTTGRAPAEPKLVPAAELPQYTAEDISTRMLSDGPHADRAPRGRAALRRKLTCQYSGDCISKLFA